MIGLAIEIQKHKHGKKVGANEKFSLTYISKLLGISYNGARHKLENNLFWGEEERAIFYSIIPREKQTFDLYKYLFTEQGS